MNANPYDDTKQATVTGTRGRDVGKTFRVNEVTPVVMAGFVLRLLAALRLSQQDDLMGLLQPVKRPGEADNEDNEDAISSDLSSILRVLTGCDPQAVSALIRDALTYVEVAADPQHPGAFRPLQDNDIREMSTLGDVLGAFARVNLLPG